ncbi:MAG: sensor domain-containing diguanylate cyclase [candidate division Zixibacteria bacterium]|nr:sensor domain-containing diguanylate cyclase [candidate division Zixibacteria bacterium]
MKNKKESNFWSFVAQPKNTFWLIRGVIFLCFFFWFLFPPEKPDHRVWILFYVFLVYSFGFFIYTNKTRVKIRPTYFFSSFLDIVLITFLILFTDRKGSDFFLLYFLVVPFAGYAAGLLAGLSLAFLSSLFYLSINTGDLATLPGNYLFIKIAVLWVLVVAVSAVIQTLDRSRAKLLRMFDILNQRTSELEKSQAQIETIYETSRNLGEILNLEEVVDEFLNIVEKILGYQFCSIFILNDSNTLSLLGEIKQGKKIKYSEPVKKSLNGILEKVTTTGTPVRLFDLANAFGHQRESDEFKSLLAVPMISRGKVIGVLDAKSKRVGAFLNQDEKIFSTLAGSAALAIENASLHQKTKELTITDELTGIYNYRYFTRKLSQEIKRAKRYKQFLSLLMIDIDWFKRCNDTYGHLFGNKVLKELAQRIKDSVRDVDVVSRYGGEEFAVILPQTNKKDAQMIGERIRHHVESTDFEVEEGGVMIKVTVSLGVATYPEKGTTPEHLIEKVDQALYLAKGRGKNMVFAV